MGIFHHFGYFWRLVVAVFHSETNKSFLLIEKTVSTVNLKNLNEVRNVIRIKKREQNGRKKEQQTKM